MNAGIETLKAALPTGAWTQDPDLIDPHLREWRDKYFGQTPILITPRNTEEVATAVKICAEHKLPIMPQGGNTGLVGGNTPQDEVLISLKKMTAVRDINVTANAMTVEAGATLQSVLDSADGADRKFPLTLSSQGSCTVGGVLIHECWREPCFEIWHNKRARLWRRSRLGRWIDFQRSHVLA